MARPGTPGRINNQKLCQLLVEDGRTQKQATVDSGASEAAVSKRLKKLRWNLTRHVGLKRFREVADRGLDVFAQLHAINRTIREELAWAVDAARQPAGDRKSLQQVIADLAGEIRKKLAFQVDVLGSLHDMRAVADFQQEVLDAIQEPRPKVATGSSTRSLRDELFAGRFSVPTLWGGDEALATREEYRRRLHGWKAAHPGQPVPENGGIHRGEPVQALLGRTSRLHLEPFPPYGPELNPDEGVWNHLKAHLANGRPDTAAELLDVLTEEVCRLAASPALLRGCIEQSDLTPFLL